MSVSHRLWANGSIRFGALVLGFMILVSLLAPWLGTVDPSAMDSNFINKPAGLKGDFTLLDGSTVARPPGAFGVWKKAAGWDWTSAGPQTPETSSCIVPVAPRVRPAMAEPRMNQPMQVQATMQAERSRWDVLMVAAVGC